MRLPSPRNETISQRSVKNVISEPLAGSGLSATDSDLLDLFRASTIALERSKATFGGKGKGMADIASLTVGYRRVAGKIGLTDNENGVRGAWVEKRVELLKNLLKANYKILLLSKLTEATTKKGFHSLTEYERCDLLILEFGGINQQFYGKDWEQTLNMIKAHTGKILFINDDPDLPFVWNLLPDEDWSRWTIGANAVNPEQTAHILKTPKESQTIDFPLLPDLQNSYFNLGIRKKIIYIGRPNGREKVFSQLVKSSHLTITGKSNEWQKFPQIKTIDYPQQKDRKEFYQQFTACLAIYDRKHMLTGWRTGRAYHALAAGIPVAAPRGNKALDWCYPINSTYAIASLVKMTDQELQNLWEEQKQSALRTPTTRLPI